MGGEGPERGRERGGRSNHSPKSSGSEDGGDDGRIGDEGEDLHGAAAGGTEERQDLIDPDDEHGPADARQAG
jgi:hypothetical protein